MYLKISRNAKGRASLSICEKYRDPITRKPKDRIIRSLGFADTYDHLYDDPIAHFRDVVKQMNEEQKHVSSLSVLIDMDEALVPDSSDLKMLDTASSNASIRLLRSINSGKVSQRKKIPILTWKKSFPCSSSCASSALVPKRYL